MNLIQPNTSSDLLLFWYQLFTVQLNVDNGVFTNKAWGRILNPWFCRDEFRSTLPPNSSDKSRSTLIKWKNGKKSKKIKPPCHAVLLSVKPFWEFC